MQVKNIVAKSAHELLNVVIKANYHSAVIYRRAPDYSNYQIKFTCQQIELLKKPHHLTFDIMSWACREKVSAC